VSAFKRSVLAELKREPAAANVTNLVRSYVRGISRVHHDFRALIEGDLRAWRLEFARVLAIADRDLGQRVGLAVVVREDDGSLCGVIDIMDHLIHRLNALRARYSTLSWISDWSICGETGG
jgi:hypothetical protein